MSYVFCCVKNFLPSDLKDLTSELKYKKVSFITHQEKTLSYLSLADIIQMELPTTFLRLRKSKLIGIRAKTSGVVNVYDG